MGHADRRRLAADLLDVNVARFDVGIGFELLAADAAEVGRRSAAEQRPACCEEERHTNARCVSFKARELTMEKAVPRVQSVSS